MPLPQPNTRAEIHKRNINMRAYRRQDGLYDIEGHITDSKPTDCATPFGPLVPAGQPIHEMWIRLTIDKDFLVHEAIAATDAAPYGDCLGAPATLQRLVGTRIGAGWTRETKERLGGVKSCTHLLEMLTPLGTAAYQAMWAELKDLPEPLDRSGKPMLINTCWSMASHRELALRRWPDHYTGSAKPTNGN